MRRTECQFYKFSINFHIGISHAICQKCMENKGFLNRLRLRCECRRFSPERSNNLNWNYVRTFRKILRFKPSMVNKSIYTTEWDIGLSTIPFKKNRKYNKETISTNNTNIFVYATHSYPPNKNLKQARTTSRYLRQSSQPYCQLTSRHDTAFGRDRMKERYSLFASRRSSINVITN